MRGASRLWAASALAALGLLAAAESAAGAQRWREGGRVVRAFAVGPRLDTRWLASPAAFRGAIARAAARRVR